MAEINGLLNRRTTLKLYRGFESLPHRNEPQIELWLLYFILIEIIRMFVCLFARRLHHIQKDR